MKTLFSVILVLSVLVVPSVYAQTPAPAGPPWTYVPGGTGYALQTQQFADGWHRVTQAMNQEFLPWTFLVRLASTAPTANIDTFAMWDSATRLQIRGPIEAHLEFRRDLESSASIDPDPYVVAQVKEGSAGLGWFFSGTGIVTIGGNSIDLSGKGVHQIDFPANWAGVWLIDIVIPAGGLVMINQGERLTKTDNWALPSETP